jgi:hypothetical protein
VNPLGLQGNLFYPNKGDWTSKYNMGTVMNGCIISDFKTKSLVMPALFKAILGVTSLN